MKLQLFGNFTYPSLIFRFFKNGWSFEFQILGLPGEETWHVTNILNLETLWQRVTARVCQHT